MFIAYTILCVTSTFFNWRFWYAFFLGMMWAEVIRDWLP